MHSSVLLYSLYMLVNLWFCVQVSITFCYRAPVFGLSIIEGNLTICLVSSVIYTTFCRAVKVTVFMLLVVENSRSWQLRLSLFLFY